MESIPVVDFSALSLDTESDDDLDCSVLRQTADQLIDAFRTVGFVYLQNTGFPGQLLNAVMSVGQKFLDLPEHVKRRHNTRSQQTGGWYVALEQEGVDTSRPGDLKECLNIALKAFESETLWPTHLPTLKSLSFEFFSVCSKLAKRVLLAMAYGLQMPDVQFFDRCHNIMTRVSGAGTTMRFLKYPEISKDLKPNQVRLGEHSDYGSITLLFQDDVGGLQVKTRDGKWIEAVPIPNTILVNIADLMQRWTADYLVSTPHRLLIPEEEIRRRTVRRSLAFFVHPDPEFVVCCLDGSDKYEPIAADKYLQQKLDATYAY